MPTTVLGEYKSAVLVRRPDARLRQVADYPRNGDTSYQIFLGNKAFGHPQESPTTAWREADALLSNVPDRRLLEMTHGRPVTDDEISVATETFFRDVTKTAADLRG